MDFVYMIVIRNNLNICTMAMFIILQQNFSLKMFKCFYCHQTGSWI